MAEIKGLKGVYDLSNEDYNVWRNEQIQKGKLTERSSLKSQDRLYRNQQFIADYGIDTFNAMKASARDEFHRAKVVRQAVSDRWGEDGNQYLATLDTKGLQELYDKAWTLEEIQEKYDSLKQEAAKAKKSGLAEALDFAVRDMHGPTHLSEINYEDDFDGYYDGLVSSNKATINDIIARSNQRAMTSPAVSDAEQYIIDCQNNDRPITYNGIEMSPDDFINDAFKNIGSGAKIHYVGTDGAHDVEYLGDPYYKAFQDNEIIKDMPLEDKRKLVAIYEGVKASRGEYVASQVFSTAMQQYISDNQSGWEWLKNDGKNIVIGGMANIANKVMGAEALVIAATQGEKAEADFLYGKDTTGRLKTNYWNNPQYWLGVDQYNTLSPSEINRANQNYGISPYQNIYQPGTETDFWSWNVANEALKQTKYLWSDYLVNQCLGGAFGKVNKGLTKVNPKLGNYAGMAGVALQAGVTSLGDAEAEGMNAFNSTYEANMETLNNTVANQAEGMLSDYWMDENGKASIEALAKQAHKERLDYENQIKGSIENGAVGATLPEEMTKQLDAFEEKRFDDLIAEHGITMKAKFVKQIRMSPEYQEAAEKAKLEAADAYMIDATLKEIRGAATNALWGQYKFDKGTREFMQKKQAPLKGFIDSNADGSLNLNINRGLYKTYKTLSSAWGEFVDEAADSFTSRFASGFGIGAYNNYLANNYNATKQLDVATGVCTDFLAGLDYATKEFREAAFDRETWYEGWIGMIGGAGNTSVRFGERPGVDPNAKGFNKVMKTINNYVNNGMLSSYYEAESTLKETQDAVDRFNNNLADHRNAFQDIYHATAASQNIEASRYDTEEAAHDAKAIGRTELIELLDEWAADPIMSRSTTVQQYQADIEKIAGGKLSTEEQMQLAKQFLARNTDFMEGAPQEERIAAAFGAVRDNVVKFKEASDTYHDIKKTINKNASYLHDEIKKFLAQNMYMKSNWKDRISEMEKSISGDSYNYNGSRDARFYGSYAAYTKAVEEEKAFMESLKKQEETIDEQIKLLKDIRSKTQEQIDALDFLETQKQGILRTREVYERYVSPYSLTEEDFVNVPVVSADQILNLPADIRAQMVSNPTNYSKEQQIEIQKVIDQLNQDDPSKVQTIIDLPSLIQKADNVDYIYRQLTDKKNLSKIEKMLKAYKASLSENVESVALRKVSYETKKMMADTKSDQTLVELVWKGKGVSSTLFEEFLKENPDRDNSRNRSLLSALKTSEDCFQALKELFPGIKDGEYNTAIRAYEEELTTLTKDAITSKEILDNIREAIKATKDVVNKEFLQQVLNKLESIGYARTSTITPAEPKKGKKSEKKTEAPQATTEEPKSATKEPKLGEAESPSLREQAPNETIVSLPAVSAPENKLLSEASKVLLAGNPYMEYNPQKLNEDGIMEHKVEEDPKRFLHQFYKWLESNHIQMQEIIDNELGNILRANPNIPINFLLTKPIPTTINEPTDAVQDSLILAIRLTPEIAKYHDPARGSIKANGGEYIVIGSAWFSSPEMGNTYRAMLLDMKRHRKEYLEAHEGETVYVDETYSTRISSNGLTNGYLVKQLLGDTEVKYRSVAELANGVVGERNPEGLSVEDLKWGIVKSGQMVTVGTNERNVVLPLKDNTNREGAVYLMVKAASGKFMPVFVRPTFYNELPNCKLKERIIEELNNLTSTDFSVRVKAQDTLRTLLCFTKDTSIKTNENGNIVISEEGLKDRIFTIGASFDRTSFLQAVTDVNFRINVTFEALNSAASIRELSEAGALNVDIAKLGTADAVFDIYACNPDGTPNVVEASWAISSAPKTTSIPRSYLLEGKTYREKNGEFVDELGKPVTSEIASQLAYIKEIEDRQLTPAISDRGYDYYILRSGENPLVVKLKKRGFNLVVADEETSRKTIEKINKRIEEKNAQEAARIAAEKLKEQQEAPQDVFLDDKTPEELNASLAGVDEEIKTEEKPVEPEEPIVVPASEIVIKPNGDINNIHSIIENNLQGSEKNSNFAEILMSPTYGDRLEEILDEKGVQFETNAELEAWLKKNNISTEGITDVEAWLDMIKNCR